MSTEVNKVLDNLLNKVCAIDCSSKSIESGQTTVGTVGYVFSKQLYLHCNRLPKVKGRVSDS